MNLRFALGYARALGCAIVLAATTVFAVETPAASATGSAATPSASTVTERPKPAEKPQWVFSLLPKSMQKNPLVDLTVITEMTEAGKKLPLVTPDKPAYFELTTAGARQIGEAYGNEHALKQAEMEHVLIRALAANGYLPAHAPEKPASLLIAYSWGSHAKLTIDESVSTDVIVRNLLDRAALVGGEKFARELSEVIDQEMTWQTAAPGTDIGPLKAFRMRSYKNDGLYDQAANDIYYVVASAYDYRLAAQKQRVLLWRTRMSVATAGVSQDQTLPTLVLSAGPYFGRDMPEAETLTKRTIREGRVEVGAPTVIESSPPKAPAPKK